MVEPQERFNAKDVENASTSTQWRGSSGDGEGVKSHSSGSQLQSVDNSHVLSLYMAFSSKARLYLALMAPPSAAPEA